MRNLVTTIASASDATSFNGAAVDTNQTFSASFQFSMTDSASAGTVKIQASNDNPASTGASGPTPTFIPTNWSDIPSASVTYTASTTQGIILVPVMSFRYIRAVFTQTTAGSGTMTINMCSQSV